MSFLFLQLYYSLIFIMRFGKVKMFFIGKCICDSYFVSLFRTLDIQSYYKKVKWLRLMNPTKNNVCNYYYWGRRGLLFISILIKDSSFYNKMERTMDNYCFKMGISCSLLNQFLFVFFFFFTLCYLIQLHIRQSN